MFRGGHACQLNLGVDDMQLIPAFADSSKLFHLYNYYITIIWSKTSWFIRTMLCQIGDKNVSAGWIQYKAYINATGNGNFLQCFCSGKLLSQHHTTLAASLFILTLLHKKFVVFLKLFWVWQILPSRFQILEKNDYTSISGNPYIKKSGP